MVRRKEKEGLVPSLVYEPICIKIERVRKDVRGKENKGRRRNHEGLVPSLVSIPIGKDA
jgi:hypothetical protein